MSSYCFFFSFLSLPYLFSLFSSSLPVQTLASQTGETTTTSRPRSSIFSSLQVLIYIYIYIRETIITLHNCRHHFFMITLIPLSSHTTSLKGGKRGEGGGTTHPRCLSPTVFFRSCGTFFTDKQYTVLYSYSENNTSHTSINGTSNTPLVALNSGNSLV